MSVNNSLAQKKRWQNIPKEERSKVMSDIAKKRMEKLTVRQRKLLGKKLVAARKAKKDHAKS